MSDIQFPHIPSPRELKGAQPKPGWRRKRVLVPGVLVALIAIGSIGGADKESPEALLSVTQAADSKARQASEQAARDLAAAEAAARQAADDRAAAEAEAEAAAEAKAAAEATAAAEAAALAAQQQAAAERAAAEKAAVDKAAAERVAAEKAAAESAAAAAAQQQAAQIQPLAAAPKAGGNCTPEYPDFCIPPAGDYNCPDFSQKNFTALSPDPYRLDADNDGIACESR